MTLPLIMCQSVTRLRMGTTTGFDAYQNPIKTAPSTETLTRVSLQPLLGTASTEANGADYDRTVTRWRLFAPAGTDLVTTDRIQQGSLDLEIDGEMVTWPGPDGQPHHIEVMLKRFGG